MGGLFGGTPKVIPEFTGLQVNTAVQVLPVPLIYGSPRVNINLIYYNGFSAQLVNSQSGKGILSGGKGGKQVEYFATILLGVGEGPINPILVIYQDQEVWTPATYPSNGGMYFSGTPVQAPWSYIVDNWPTDARSYKSTAYYAFQNAQLDASATVPQIDLVGFGILAGSSPLNNSTLVITSGQYDQNGNPLSFIGNIPLGDADADPGQVILDFLTNPTYGANFPLAYIDQGSLLTGANGYVSTIGDPSVSTFCQAVGLAWSVVLNNVESASSILERWCRNLNVAVVWNGAVLRFIPYWDAPASGNPGWDPANGIPMKYYTPYLTPSVSIPLSQILQSDSKDSDPITYSRKDPWDVYNTVRVSFKDRTNFFNANTVEAKDEALVELYGPRVDNIGQAEEFSLQTYANVSAIVQLRRNAGIRRNYTWKMGPLWAWLDPMDIVEIPDPANYNNTVLVRITSLEDDEDENVTFTAEEFPVGVQSPTVIATSPTTPPNMGAVNSPPSQIYPPVMFAPTTAMLTATGFGTTAQWIFGASAGYDGIFDANWGGCNIWVSLDNVSYELLGTLTGPSTIGSLSQALGAYGGANPDTSDTLYVNLAECDGSLASVSAAAALAGNTICCVTDVSGFEILSYTTATLVSADTWALTGLYRGLYGTTARFFGAGSQFLFVGSSANIFETPVLSGYVNRTFWVKAQSFNIFNNATEELSECVAYEYTLTSPTPVPPLPPPSVQPPGRSRRQTGPNIGGKTARKLRGRP